MPYPIEQKFVIAVASSALFKLDESDRIFQEEGVERYAQYQREHEDEVLEPGVAFPLIKRLLSIRDGDGESPVEVILLSRNNPDTGLRVFNTIEHYGLPIRRAAFVAGADPFQYIESFHASLFLSANLDDVKLALKHGLAAAQVFPSQYEDDYVDTELRLAFDFDGIIADDSSEEVYRRDGLDKFQENEAAHGAIAMEEGPLANFIKAIAKLQQSERQKIGHDATFKPRIRIAVATARSAPAHKRVITTLRNMGVYVDEAFFLGGIEKARVLKVYRPHLFFDDQLIHLEEVSKYYPSAHVPFGVANNE